MWPATNLPIGFRRLSVVVVEVRENLEIRRADVWRQLRGPLDELYAPRRRASIMFLL